MFPNAPPSAYTVIAWAAFATGFFAALHPARSAGIPTARWSLLLVGLGLLAHLGGRLHLLSELGAAWQWSDLLLPGYRHPGSIAGVLLALLVLPRLLLPTVSIGLLADCVAPAVAFTSAVMRIGCLTIGCCAGTISSLPWAIRFPAESRVSQLHARLGLIPSSDLPSLHVHPLQGYFLVLAVAVGMLIVWFRPRKQYNGQVFLVFCATHEAGKAALETFRQDTLLPGNGLLVPVASVVVATLASIALAAIALKRAPRTTLSGPTAPLASS